MSINEISEALYETAYKRLLQKIQNQKIHIHIWDVSTNNPFCKDCFINKEFFERQIKYKSKSNINP